MHRVQISRFSLSYTKNILFHSIFFCCCCNYAKFPILFYFLSHLSSTATSPVTPSCAASSWPSAAGCCRRSEGRWGPGAAMRAQTRGPAASGEGGCCCRCRAPPPPRRTAEAEAEAVGEAVAAGAGERRRAGAVRGKRAEGRTRRPPAPRRRAGRRSRRAAAGAGPRAPAGPRWSRSGRRPPG